ncbi:MAG: hypothetical protein EOR94_22160 [Mesorhizobium sp.]|nr:MAG: hypothetical protein EOR94_22160 [Mesorhizobium sp.]
MRHELYIAALAARSALAKFDEASNFWRACRPCCERQYECPDRLHTEWRVSAIVQVLHVDPHRLIDRFRPGRQLHADEIALVVDVDYLPSEQLL